MVLASAEARPATHRRVTRPDPPAAAPPQPDAEASLEASPPPPPQHEASAESTLKPEATADAASAPTVTVESRAGSPEPDVAPAAVAVALSAGQQPSSPSSPPESPPPPPPPPVPNSVEPAAAAVVDPHLSFSAQLLVHKLVVSHSRSIDPHSLTIDLSDNLERSVSLQVRRRPRIPIRTYHARPRNAHPLAARECPLGG